MYQNPWIYNSEEFHGPIDEYEGFVYIITNKSSNKAYIGKKHFWTRQKGKNGRRQTKESDWRNYYGSCDDLKKDITELVKESFNRVILKLCKYKKEMSFWEEKEQWDRNVLLTDDYYNTNIAGRYFVRERKIYWTDVKEVTIFNDKWRELASERMKGENNVAKRADVRKKISDKKKGHPCYDNKKITEDHKKALHSAAMEKKKIPIIDENGVQYSSSQEYSEKTGISYYILQKKIEKGLVKRLVEGKYVMEEDTKNKLREYAKKPKVNRRKKVLDENNNIYESMKSFLKEKNMSTSQFYNLLGNNIIKYLT